MLSPNGGYGRRGKSKDARRKQSMRVIGKFGKLWKKGIMRETHRK